VTPDADRPIAFVCAMPMELRPLTKRLGLRKAEFGGAPARIGTLDGRPVVGIVTGMGTQLAAAGVERLLDAATPVHVFVVGITGAVDDETPIGTLVLPERVVDHRTGRSHSHHLLGPGQVRGTLWTTDGITPPSDLPDLRARGVVALDMETAAIAFACEERGVPWSVYRAISDRATDGSVDDEVFGMSRPAGTPDPGAVARYLVRHPGRIPGLVRLARGASLAANRAADAAVAAVRAAASGGGNDTEAG
jgi:adenosylhomocysteine nucleosidase